MSMTREEAIASYEKLYDYMVGDDDVIELDYGEFMELNHYIRSALRPVSREQVEKVWSGCPYCKEDGEGYVKKFGAYSIQNGELTTGHCKPQKIKFCPHCSRPLTDEAVQMVLERLEAMKDGLSCLFCL